MNILTILEQSAAEIRALRERVENSKEMIISLTMRIAVSQMRGNRIDYKDAYSVQWATINALIESGRMVMDYTGDVFLDQKPLTINLLSEEMKEALNPKP